MKTSNTIVVDLRQISITDFACNLHRKIFRRKVRPTREPNEEGSARHCYHGNHIISSSSSTSWRWRRWTDAAESASQFIIEQNKFPTKLWVIKAATSATNAHMGKHVGNQATDCWMWPLIRGRFIWKRQQRRPEDTDGAWFDTSLSPLRRGVHLLDGE